MSQCSIEMVGLILSHSFFEMKIWQEKKRPEMSKNPPKKTETTLFDSEEFDMILQRNIVFLSSYY